MRWAPEGDIHGGEATNVVTDRVELKAECRSHNPKFREKIQAQIEKDRLAQSSALNEAQIAAESANVDRAKGAYERLIEQVDALRVRAGIDGVLQQVLVEPGQRIGLGSNIASVARPGWKPFTTFAPGARMLSRR